MKEDINLNTFNFAKRQMTWFKKDKTIKWIKNQKQAEKIINSFLRN
jgi:tRNA A37 N6-isopentenylltransferase MiaA